MNVSNASLYATLFMSMLETNAQNCIDIFNKIELDIDDKIKFLEGTINVISNNGTMTREMTDKIHILYNKLLSNHPSKKMEIVDSYNDIKGLLNQNDLDNSNKLIYEDIIQREFQIHDKRLVPLYDNNAKLYFTLHYNELMDDIAFDFNVINYLVHPFMEIDNDICADERFIKSLRYIVHLNHEMLDYEMYIKIKVTLEYRETLINKGFIDNLKMKKEHKKIIKRLGSKYDK